MTPIDTLFRRASEHPDALAFVSGDEVWTYRRLASEVDRLAGALVEQGLRAGHRVALHMANLPDLVVAYYVCFRIGAIACPLNVRLKTAELLPLLDQLRPALYLGEADLYPRVAAVHPDILPSEACFIVGGGSDENGARPWDGLFKGAARRTAACNPDADSPAVLLTTSGTTGQPKFVAHTPTTLAAVAESFLHLGFERDQVAVNAVPMVHIGGLATLLGCVRFGRPMILFDRFDADALLDAMEPRQCSWLIGTPFMYSALVDAQRARPRTVHALRFCLVAGDVCPPELQQNFANLFGTRLRSFWGSTETFGTFTFGTRPGPVSRPAPGTQFQLVDDSGAQPPHGEIGELLVRGPSVSVGYWSGPGRIAAPGDGWFHTGDLMREEDDGHLLFVSRKKDLIIRGGSNISPIEVEQVLSAHPAVLDAAVVGVPDPVLGQRVVGLVRLADHQAKLEDILTDARAQLADYKVPERLEVVAEIPRNALGKIDRKSLLAMVQPPQ
jgi:acyl-CoA synthetase (AMP-forming)/AMP-acid ligase II